MPTVFSAKEMRPRHKDDFYPTQQATVLAMLRSLDHHHLTETPDRILDPGSGTGSFAQGVQEFWKDEGVSVFGVEVDEERASQDKWSTNVLVKDFLQTEPPDFEFDLVIGNPPFKYAEQFIRKSANFVRTNGRIAFLLSLSFLASQTRYKLFTHEPLMVLEAVHIFSKRPSFLPDGSKTYPDDYGMFVFQLVNYVPEIRKFNPELFWINPDWMK